MLFSMTGYGKSTASVGEKIISVEIRTLNSKSCDLYLKTPNQYKDLEVSLRKSVSELLKRGKIDFTLSIEQNNSTSSSSHINQNLALNYFNDLKKLSAEIGQQDVDYISTILRIPGVLTNSDEEISDEEKKIILDLTAQVCQTVNKFRRQEGVALEKDFTAYIENIRTLLSQVSPFEKERIDTIKERMLSSLAEIGNYDENRFHQEMIFYLEKLDVSEEKMRLTNHLDYFLKTMNSMDDGGKKLGFIAQEIGREINTLGSKANHSEIQKIVVNMKDTLEKIKEQVLNTL